MKPSYKIRSEVISKLCCPVCKGNLKFGSQILCLSCRKKYRFIKGVPCFIEDKEINAGIDTQKKALGILSLIGKYNQSLTNIILRFVKIITGKVWSGSDYTSEQLVKEASRLIKRRKLEVLDLGAGENNNHKKILSKLGEYFSVDILASEKLDAIADGYALPFKDNSFDCIALFCLLEHCSKPVEILKEVRRVIRKDALVLIYVPQYWHIHGYPSDYYRYTRYGIEFICQEAGLVPEKIWGAGGRFILLFNMLTLNFFKNIPLLGPLMAGLSLLILNPLDKLFYKYDSKLNNFDTTGWCAIARAKKSKTVKA